MHVRALLLLAAGGLKSLLCPATSSAVCPVLHSTTHLAVSQHTHVRVNPNTQCHTTGACNVPAINVSTHQVSAETHAVDAETLPLTESADCYCHFSSTAWPEKAAGPNATL